MSDDWEEQKRQAQSPFTSEVTTWTDNDIRENGGIKERDRDREPEEKYLALIQEARFELGERHPFLAYPLTGLGDLHLSEGRYEEAESLYQQAISVWEEQPTENRHIISPLSNLGVTYIRIGRYEEAASLFERVVEIEEKGDKIGLVQTLDHLAFIHASHERNEEAEVLYRRADALAAELSPPYHRLYPPIHSSPLLSFDEQTLEGAQQLYQQTFREERHLPPKPAWQPSVSEPEEDRDLEPGL